MPDKPPRAHAAGRQADPLDTYHAKRDFSATPEPRGESRRRRGGLSFVIQKHAASHLHYDFRLELDGVLLSWAVPKGPSLDPAVKRLAVQVEDHPLSYGGFEGEIPPGHYGAGHVIVWDRGSWTPDGDPHAGLKAGKLAFQLQGEKLQGGWELVRTGMAGGSRGGNKPQWLLFKKRDALARPAARGDILEEQPDSVLSGRSVGPAAPPAQSSREPSKNAATPAKSRRAARAAPASQASALRKPARASRATLPATMEPQLATLVSEVPGQGEWLYEMKLDGYRMLARFQRGQPRLFTRNGHDWSTRMPALVAALQDLALDSGWLDGEVVVLDGDGLPSFQALQRAFDGQEAAALVYFLFDAPFLAGEDLRARPLRERRDALRSLLARAYARDDQAAELLRLSEDFDAAPAALLNSACNMGLEGVMLKRADSPYRSGRGDDWLKLKCKRRQEFVIAGYSRRSDGAAQIGSLALGVHDEQGRLVSVGGVGTGWDMAEARRLLKVLQPLDAKKPPFAAGEPARRRHGSSSAGPIQWVKPLKVAEVAFAGWTGDGQIRHAAYTSLRDDKPASEIRREEPQPAPERARAVPAAKGGGLAITHPERVIDPQSGLTKLDLAQYMDAVAEHLIKHLRGRPVSLLRAPGGVGGQTFFQKHAEPGSLPGVIPLDPTLWPGHEALMEMHTRRALLGAAQMNAVELHTWNATTAHIDQPDRLVFDLDPGEGVAWPRVQEAATLVRELLDELGLRCWLKTSGGKGLHVVVPLAPRWEADTLKAFSRALVQHLAQTVPSRFVAKSGPANRVGRIFVDYLRNGLGATTVAAFSARARPGLGVSMPVDWDELPQLTGGAHWTIASAPAHLARQRRDPWAGYWRARQSLDEAMAALDFQPPA